MKTKIIYVSRDNDNIVKFWNQKPFYNDCEDDFHGKAAEILPETVDKIRHRIGDDCIEMGEYEPFIIAKEGAPQLSYSKRIRKNHYAKTKDIVDALEKGFRQFVISFGDIVKGSGFKRYEGFSFYDELPFFDVSPFCQKIIRNDENGLRLTCFETLEGIYADPDMVKSDDDLDCTFLGFVVKRETISWEEHVQTNMEDILENNANQYFDLLDLLEYLESHIIYEKEMEPEDEDVRNDILASRFYNCISYGVLSADDKDFVRLISALDSQFGFKAGKEKEHLINQYGPYGGFYFGYVLGETSLDTVFVIGKENDCDHDIKWYVLTDESGLDADVHTDIQDGFESYFDKFYIHVTGDKEAELERIKGYDFFKEVADAYDEFDMKQYFNEEEDDD